MMHPLLEPYMGLTWEGAAVKLKGEAVLFAIDKDKSIRQINESMVTGIDNGVANLCAMLAVGDGGMKNAASIGLWIYRKLLPFLSEWTKSQIFHLEWAAGMAGVRSFSARNERDLPLVISWKWDKSDADKWGGLANVMLFASACDVSGSSTCGWILISGVVNFLSEGMKRSRIGSEKRDAKPTKQ